MAKILLTRWAFVASDRLTRMRIRALTLLVVVLALWASTGMPAGAHVELFESDPAAGGTTDEGDRDISLTFVSLDTSEPIRVGVVDEDGTNFVSGTPRVRPPDRGTEVVVPVRPLTLGEYTVTWTAASDDGDGEATGSFTFTVVESTQSDATWVFAIGALVVVAGVGVALLRLSRRS